MLAVHIVSGGLELNSTHNVMEASKLRHIWLIRIIIIGCRGNGRYSPITNDYTLDGLHCCSAFVFFMLSKRSGLSLMESRDKITL